MNYYGSTTGFTFGLPLFFLNEEFGEDYDVKLNDDRYQIYVNEEYVGDHTMFLPKEDASAVVDFLHTQGFKHVNMEVNGDHIVIHTESREEAEQMETALKVYVRNR
ncbi:hypothetical protein SAMN05421736_12811 [Evansella caseinilytica]|uniref:Uncharacterized protein n=1 Tax=Evansella caseinilytica TaxID=1503961 RepID=A0A1H3UX11_9BACI|nr:hypothetical protein [Evansella caseinilytica]SDZ66826.1 hypothetical protein SAMN05421736_12811 [Evansella caseinilytica]